VRTSQGTRVHKAHGRCPLRTDGHPSPLMDTSLGMMDIVPLNGHLIVSHTTAAEGGALCRCRRWHP